MRYGLVIVLTGFLACAGVRRKAPRRRSDLWGGGEGWRIWGVGGRVGGGGGGRNLRGGRDPN